LAVGWLVGRREQSREFNVELIWVELFADQVDLFGVVVNGRAIPGQRDENAFSGYALLLLSKWM
jgi:hypothetical protein